MLFIVAFELDESLAAKIMADRAGGVWGQRAADDDTSNSDSAPHSGFMAPQPTSNPSQLAEYKVSTPQVLTYDDVDVYVCV